ncbi:MAG: hypothetical protein ABJF11_00770 [Reichenbachiella sp.]|uniref:hypothetical protein n=1 Tax=Reichenbachiella sp. TaxID=2184521 RepID=UPI0032659A35
MKLSYSKPALFISLFCLISFLSAAQTRIDPDKVKIKNDSTTEKFLYKVVTKSGNKIIGEVVKVSSDSLTLSNADLGQMDFPLSNVSTFTVYNPMEENDGERYMVGANHYLIAPSTPYGLEKGEINLQNSEIFLMSAWFGLNKYFSVGGGLSILPGVEFNNQLFYLIPKFNFPVTPKINVSVQYAQIFHQDIDNTSLMSFSAAYGSRDRHISFGYTTPVFADGDDIAFEAALYNIGAVYRTGNKFALLLDINIPSVDSDVGIYGLGARYIGRSSSFDFGFLSNSEIEGFPFPWFNYTIRLK